VATWPWWLSSRRTDMVCTSLATRSNQVKPDNLSRE
jgi:hypothetical protein